MMLTAAETAALRIPAYRNCNESTRLDGRRFSRVMLILYN